MRFEIGDHWMVNPSSSWLASSGWSDIQAGLQNQERQLSQLRRGLDIFVGRLNGAGAADQYGAAQHVAGGRSGTVDALHNRLSRKRLDRGLHLLDGKLCLRHGLFRYAPPGVSGNGLNPKHHEGAKNGGDIPTKGRPNRPVPNPLV